MIVSSEKLAVEVWWFAPVVVERRVPDLLSTIGR